jgi:hypothetical protein
MPGLTDFQESNGSREQLELEVNSLARGGVASYRDQSRAARNRNLLGRDNSWFLL